MSTFLILWLASVVYGSLGYLTYATQLKFDSYEVFPAILMILFSLAVGPLLLILSHDRSISRIDRDEMILPLLWPLYWLPQPWRDEKGVCYQKRLQRTSVEAVASSNMGVIP